VTDTNGGVCSDQINTVGLDVNSSLAYDLQATISQNDQTIKNFDLLVSCFM
jgi:hypothetical protein